MPSKQTPTGNGVHTAEEPAVVVSATGADFGVLREIIASRGLEMARDRTRLRVYQMAIYAIVITYAILVATRTYVIAELRSDVDAPQIYSSTSTAALVWSIVLTTTGAVSLSVCGVLTWLSHNLRRELLIQKHIFSSLLSLARDTGAAFVDNGNISKLQWEVTKLDLSRYGI